MRNDLNAILRIVGVVNNVEARQFDHVHLFIQECIIKMKVRTQLGNW